ncbi:E3 ubiquitin-protein ligase XIAP [Pholidichthys leucotaenia]
MGDFSCDDWETDHMADYSDLKMRLNSFRGSTLQVPAERLARAGFYYTGHADRVRCFSCETDVENWCTEDTPVERHKEVSPTCKFLNCAHRNIFKLNHQTQSTNGSIYNEEVEDREYRVRTGEVVDETPYPKIPSRKSEEARLQTFCSWPPTAPVRPRGLAQAGLFYLGRNDQVQCFCCGGILSGWETGDTAWEEHNRHFPNCFFILGHDVGNIPFHGTSEEEESGGSSRHVNTQWPMQSFEERLRSFEGVQHPLDTRRLARAGFYSTGTGDHVKCFSCDGGLKSWQPEDDPWEEHAKYYPGCRFLLAEKGQEFINNIQLQGRGQNRATTSHQNGFTGHGNEVLRSAMAQKALEMGLKSSVVEKIILEKISETGSGYSRVEDLVEDCLKSPEIQDEDPMEKLRKLQKEKQCKICMDRDIDVVFIPCGHLVCCKECSMPLLKCPICCGAISQRIRTYIA